MFKTSTRVFAIAAFSAAAAFAGPNDSVWTQLFNPKDTNISNNWDLKVRYSAVNADTRNTWRYGIANGDTFIEVNYSNYTSYMNTSPSGPLHGHAGYKHRPFSYYLLRGEYMVYGTARAPGVTSDLSWANQNNGFMLHSQSVASMAVNQDFPISLEAQLLGPGNGTSTMNLCTPGTGFSSTPTSGVNSTHCTNSRSGIARAAVNSWQKVSALILGDSLHRYMAGPNGTDSVFQYYRPVYLEGSVSGAPAGSPTSGRLTGGYITIQSESHPYRFRKIDVLNLEGCMTPTDVNYKTYFVKHDTSACNKPAGLVGGRQDIRASAPMNFVGNSIKVGGAGMVTLQVFDLRGHVVAKHTAQAPFQWTPAVTQSGMHVIRAITPRGSYTERAPLF